MNKGVVLGE